MYSELLSTEAVTMRWIPAIEVPVQLDHRLQEIIESVMQGVREAEKGEGEYMEDADLATDDDD